MSPGLPARLVDSFMAPKDILQEFGDLAEEENVDSFTAPKDILQEFADLTEEENVDPFAEMQSQCQIAYHMPELESPAVYLMLV